MRSFLSLVFIFPFCLWAQPGAPDPDFHSDDPDLLNASEIFRSYLQEDGKLILKGDFYYVNPSEDCSEDVIRIHPDGKLDTTFKVLVSETGLAIGSLGLYRDRIYAECYDTRNFQSIYKLIRLKQNGRIDPTFKPDRQDALRHVSGFHVQEDGQAIAWGEGLWRFRWDGSTDREFLGLERNQDVSDVVVLKNGDLLVSGNFTNVQGVKVPSFARFKPNGRLDRSFQPEIPRWEYVQEMIPIDDGSVLVSWYDDGEERLRRLSPNGKLDQHFRPIALPYDDNVGVILTKSQQILRWRTIGYDEIRIERYRRDGSLDEKFHFVTSTIAGQLRSVTELPNGKYLLVGSLKRASNPHPVPALVLHSDGTIDLSFDMIPENQVTYSRFLPESRPASLGFGDSSLLQRYSPALFLGLQPDGKVLLSLNPDFDFFSGSTTGVSNTYGFDEPPQLLLRLLTEGDHPPHRPYKLAAFSETPKRTRVTWNDVEDERGYIVEHRSEKGWTTIARLDRDVTSFLNDDPSYSGDGEYRVRAFNRFGKSLASSPFRAVQPAALVEPETEMLSPTTVEIRWSGIRDAWNYDVYLIPGRSRTDIHELAPIATLPGSAHKFQYSKLVPQGTYTFVIQARNGIGVSQTRVIVKMPSDKPPEAPRHFLAAPGADGTIKLVWLSSEWAESYEIQRRVHGTHRWQKIAERSAKAGTYQDSHISEGKYEYRLLARNSVGVAPPVEAIAESREKSWSPAPVLVSDFGFSSPSLPELYRKRSDADGFFLLYDASLYSSELGFYDEGDGRFHVDPDWYEYCPDAAVRPDGTFVGITRPGLRSLHPDPKRKRFDWKDPADGSFARICALRNNKVIVTGDFFLDFYRNAYIARLDEFGKADRSFTSDGILPLPENEYPSQTIELTDGSLLVQIGNRTLVCLEPDGKRRGRFGKGGAVIFDEDIADFKESGRNKVLVVGKFRSFVSANSIREEAPGIVLLNPQGRKDFSFDAGKGITGIKSLEIDEIGRVYLVGLYDLYGDLDSSYDHIPCGSVARIFPNGALDPAFVVDDEFDSRFFFIGADQCFYSGYSLKKYKAP